MQQRGSEDLPSALANAVSPLRLVEAVPGVRLVGFAIVAAASDSPAPVLPIGQQDAPT